MSDLHPQTGPRTPEGKARCSQNALTFGFTSQKLIIGSERQEDYNALVADFVTEFKPTTAYTRGLVEDAAHARWMLWRKQRAYNALEAHIYQACPEEAVWDEDIFRRIALADRYRTNAERAFKRAITNVETLRKLNFTEQDRELRRIRWEQNQEAKQAGIQLTSLKKELDLAKANEEAYHRACNGFSKPTFVQKIEVRANPGCCTETLPELSNDFILQYLAAAHTYPPEQIVRKFHFPQGIPPEYFWTTERDDYRNRKHHTLEETVSIEAFRVAAAKEHQLGTGHFLSAI